MIQDKEKYKNSQTIQNLPIFQTDGKFDEKKFNNAYEQALYQFNTLSDLTDSDNIFFRDDIFAKSGTKDNKPYGFCLQCDLFTYTSKTKCSMYLEGKPLTEKEYENYNTGA